MSFMKNGRVELRNVLVPDEPVYPGDEFEVILETYNHESFIVNDPDGCSQANTPCSGVDGYCINAQVDVDGQNAGSRDYCLNLPFSGVPPNKELVVFELESPGDEGVWDVDGVLEAEASGNITDPESAQIETSLDANRGTKFVDPPATGGTQLKDGRVSFDGIVLPPTEMLPGYSFEYGVVASNSGSVIVNDPDGCSESDTRCEGTVDGYCIAVESFVADGPMNESVFCLNLPFTGTGSNTETELFVGQTPTDEGEYGVEATLVADGSGARTDVLERGIVVSEDAPAPEDGDTYRIQTDDDDNQFELPDIERIVTLLVVGVGLYALAQIAGAVGAIAD